MSLPLDDLLVRRAYSLMVASGWERPHVEQVARLSLHIFDQIAPALSLEPSARSFLAAGALIHDTCYRTDRKEHHKAAYRLALEELLADFGPTVANAVGLVARYHRGAHPCLSHGPYSRLSGSEQLRVRQLASLLRIADGLDRTHEQTVIDVSCTLQPTFLHIAVTGLGNLNDVLQAARTKGDLFALTFDLSLILVGCRTRHAQDSDDNT